MIRYTHQVTGYRLQVTETVAKLLPTTSNLQPQATAGST
jgi:hypothetical protein